MQETCEFCTHWDTMSDNSPLNHLLDPLFTAALCTEVQIFWNEWGKNCTRSPPTQLYFFLWTTSAEYDRKQKHLFPVALLYCASSDSYENLKPGCLGSYLLFSYVKSPGQTQYTTVRYLEVELFTWTSRPTVSLVQLHNFWMKDCLDGNEDWGLGYLMRKKSQNTPIF